MGFTGSKIKWKLPAHKHIIKVRPMQIPCISCQSRFRLDSSLVKATGSLVRCSKCKYIFRVYPPANDEPTTKETKMDQSAPDGLFEVERANMANGSPVKISEELKRYQIDEIASIDAFEEEQEDPEIEDIDPAELTELSEYEEMTEFLTDFRSKG